VHRKETIVSDLQKQVQTTIDELVSSGAERGLQVAVYHQGEQVVDAVAGLADPQTGRPVTSDTPFYCYSVGKGATSTIGHMLVERGLFGYDTPVVELWPEFGAHGKQTATVRHVLTHSVGVPGIPAETTREDLCDWDLMCARIADLTPWWEPGTQTGYHAYTYGYIVGELVRRATGKRISQVLREELAGPLGVADELYFGMPASELGRLARLEDAPGGAEMLASMPDDSPMFRAGPKATWPDAEFGNRRDILMADIPAGGKNSARAIARMYAALLGEVDGVRLLPPERVREIAAPAMRGIDQVFGNPVTWGLGYSIGQLGSNADDSPTVIGMGGVGGSWACADTATGTAIAVAKNLLTADFSTSERITGIVAEAVANG
jgi:CubicO group peptidase (beta-lactamase class C family)